MSLGMMNPYQPSFAQMQAQAAPPLGSLYWVNQCGTASTAGFNAASTASSSTVYSNAFTTATGCASTTTVVANNILGASGLGGGGGGIGYSPMASVDAQGRISYRPQDGYPCRLTFPDGTVIDLKADGSFTIEDQNAQVTYRANRLRDFNTFLNASDRLEEFIAFCGEQGVSQDDMLNLPINLFIGWLIVEAARADKEPEPEVPLLEDLRKHVQGEPMTPIGPLADPVEHELSKLRAEVAALRADKVRLEAEVHRLEPYEMAEEVIGLCRDYIEKELGANCGSTALGPSPFFDDLVYGVVNELVRSRQELAQLRGSGSMQLYEIAA